MITCIVTNWGVTIVLGLLLTFSEWLAKTNRTKANGIIDFITMFLRHILNRGPKN
jgi:hypothetical protein